MTPDEIDQAIELAAGETTQSKFCAGTYIDGAWIHEDRGCEDDVRFAVLDSPSDSITVRVNPASNSAERAGIATVDPQQLKNSTAKQ